MRSDLIECAIENVENRLRAGMELRATVDVILVTLLRMLQNAEHDMRKHCDPLFSGFGELRGAHENSVDIL